jgi:hypothetical protein
VLPSHAAFYLGVSRTRMYQIMEAGHLPVFECFGRQYIGCDALDVMYEMQKERRTPGFRYSYAT